MSISHAPEDYDCPFCLIAAGIENEDSLTLQDHIVLRTENLIAFVSSHQFSKGLNVLLVPKAHIENLYAMPSQLGQELIEAKLRIAIALKELYHAEGVSVRQHNEPAGSRDVWHYHEHITARFEGDDLYGQIAAGSRLLIPAELRSDQAQRLRRALRAS